MIRRTLILIIALLFCYVVWWVGPLIAIGPYFPLGDVWVRQVIIALVLCWALWPFVAIFFSWIFRHARAPIPQRKKKTVQLDRVSARFHDAMLTLQHTDLASQKTRWQRWRQRRKRQYIDAKPWFLVMGPSGCGKTSIIYESGEKFLLSEQYGLAQTTDIGPTQDCNWWLTDRAVYIDTAGEWILLHGQSEAAGTARQKLFSMIRKHRRYPGVDGIILCLDVEMLLHASLTERKSLADTLRLRILEVASTFQADIAVYLFLNNIDKLPGGKTFLSLMNDDLLAEGLGISMTHNEQGQNNFAADAERYHEFLSGISRYVLEILHDSPNMEMRHQLLLFTESLGAIQKPLFGLFEQMFPSTPIGYTGCLRQFWLGSTQNLTPWEALYYPSSTSAVEDRPAGSMYFPALSQAITERGVLHSSGPMPLRNRLLAFSKYAAVTLGLGIILLLLAMRYFWEYDYIGYATARFDETRRIVRDIPLTNQVNDNLVAAYEQLGYINTHYLESSPPLLTPYFEHRLLNQAMLETYHRHLNKVFWPAVENYIANELKKDTQSFDIDNYDTLKIYLMLAQSDNRSPQDLVQWFMARWESFAPQGYTQNDRKLFSYHLSELFSRSSTAAPKAKLNDELIREARIKAMKTPIHIRVVNRIQDMPLPARIENITLADAAGSSVTLMLRRKSPSTVTDMAIPAFYTRASYHDVVNPQLQEASETMINEEKWVLSDGKSSVSKVSLLAAAQKLSDEARKFYLMEYANQWDAFLKDIRVRPINGLDDAALLARQFSDPSSPLANLVRFASRETTLTSESSTKDGMSSGWFDTQRNKLTNARRSIIDEISGERSRFRLTPEKAVEDRFETLRRLGYALQSASTSNADPLAKTFEQIYNQLITLSTSLRAGQILPQNNDFNRLQIDMARQPEPVRSVMMDLLEVGQTQSLQQSKANLSKGVSSIASDLCNTTVRGRYPFNRSAREEIGIGDFNRMFGRTGAMQSFFDQNLAPYIDTNGNRWQVKPDSDGVVTQKTLRAFENAALIRDTFFDASDKMAMSMIIRPISLTPSILEAVLDVDGQILTYSHGSSQPMRFEWPGPKGGVYIRLTFKTREGNVETVSFNGPWAIFRMYDASNAVPLGPNSRELTMAMNNISGFFNVELSSTMKDYPLWSKALTQFSCPKNL
jgi:type VI secretion system protein ImpL